MKKLLMLLLIGILPMLAFAQDNDVGVLKLPTVEVTVPHQTLKVPGYTTPVNIVVLAAETQMPVVQVSQPLLCFTTDYNSLIMARTIPVMDLTREIGLSNTWQNNIIYITPRQYSQPRNSWEYIVPYICRE